MAVYRRPGVFVENQLTPLADSNSGVPGAALACFVGAYHRGPNKAVVVSSWSQFTRLYGDFVDSKGNYLPFAVYQFFSNGGQAAAIARVENTDATNSTLTIVDKTTPSAEDILQIDAVAPGEWGNDLFIAIQGSSTSDRFNFVVYMGGTADSNIVERFVDLSVNPVDSRYAVTLINSPLAGSAYVKLTNLKDVPGWVYVQGQDNPATLAATAMADGLDGTTPGDIVATGTARLDAFEGSILNVNAPGVSDTSVLNGLVSWAESRTNTFIVADGPVPPSGTQTSAQVTSTYLTQANAMTNSKAVALYGPWLMTIDPSSAVPGATRWLPPGGAVLGQYSRSDTLRGVQKTPAGIDTGLNGVIALEARFTQADLDSLNDGQVNAIKVVPGRGFCIFGGRTLDKGFPTRYVAVSRTLMQLEHDFQEIVAFAVFEPNGPELWGQINAVLSNYLTTQMQVGTIQGNVAEEAFFIICDSSNNTPSQVQAGIVDIQVGVAVASPAEFLIITVSQISGTSPSADSI